MRYFFISLLEAAPWGGSEELWSRTALRLLAAGAYVAVSVPDWSPEPPPIARLRAAGAEVFKRPKCAFP